MVSKDAAREIMIVWIDRIVFSQFYIVLGLSLFTVVLMAYRRRRQLRLQELKNEYAELFINELLSQMDADSKVFLRRPPKWKWLGAEAMRETLLAQINSLSGSERDYAVKRYIDLKFAEDDIQLCLSHYWWIRLEGVSHLNALKADAYARVFNHMRKDENPLIALYSLLGLSFLNNPLNNPELFKTLGRYVQRQDNILLEITRNWSQAFGLEKLVDYVNSNASDDFHDTFVRAICRLKTPEAATLVAGFLKNRLHISSAEVVAEMIHCLREVGDPTLEVDMPQYLHHDDELVRQRALEFMINVDGSVPENLIEMIEKDPSPGVRRIYREWISRGQAA